MASFKNVHVSNLYNHVTGSKVSNLKCADDIRVELLPLITAVINDADAYSEALTWPEFNNSVGKHVDGKKAFERMDMPSSMCFSLWMYIYH